MEDLNFEDRVKNLWLEIESCVARRNFRGLESLYWAAHHWKKKNASSIRLDNSGRFVYLPTVRQENEN